MKLKDILKKSKTYKEFVKIKCVDKIRQIYVLEALCDFEIYGEQISKGSISGRIMLNCADETVTLKGMNWIHENATLILSGKCEIENSYFYTKYRGITLINSSVINSYFYAQEVLSISPKIEIENSKIEGSTFIIKTTLGGKSRSILVTSSNVKNCNFYTKVIPPSPLFDVDYIDGVALFEIKNSTVANITTLKDVSVINSKINEDNGAEKVYVDGEFFVKKSEMKFTTNKAYVEFPRLPYYSAGYFKKNVTLNKYTKIWTTMTSGYTSIKTYDENEEKICMRFAKIEPEILASYNLFKVEEDKKLKIEENKKRQVRINENKDINIIVDERAGNDILQTSDNSKTQNDKEAAGTTVIDLEVDRNNRLEEVKKKAKELGIEL